jgi:Zn-dependent membrane protease YugP
MFYWWNPYYWLFMAPALLLMLWAQWRVRSSYAKWGRAPNSNGVHGVDVAQRLLRENGLYGVNIQGAPGELTDNYDPRRKVLNLSQGTATQPSVASMAIVAHEVGHAQQDAQNFVLLNLRSGIVPIVNIGSRVGPILFIIGWLLQWQPLLWLGILAFAGAFVFALITLPVELDASRRAMKMLTASGLIVDSQDRQGARAVLSSAAWTYVAGLLTALMQLLYYVSLAAGGRRRRS